MVSSAFIAAAPPVTGMADTKSIPINDGVISRFWKHVGDQPSDDCWMWKGAKNNHGYGKMWGEEDSVKAHRVSYKIENGEMPDGMCVLHTCANRACVNPDHLYTGTQSENMVDSYEHGNRSVEGSDNPNSKLTDDQVREIRSRAGGESYVSLGEEYGVSDVQIRRIALKEQRADVPERGE